MYILWLLFSLGVGDLKHFLENGYVVVVQDVRGRFESEGEFEPYSFPSLILILGCKYEIRSLNFTYRYFNEGKDGYDTIEWIAKQPWCDGRVGTFGLSYPGAVQWLAAIENPPHLKAIFPAMTFSSPTNFVYAGGIFLTLLNLEFICLFVLLFYEV
jgi:predicted acyl esterase